MYPYQRTPIGNPYISPIARGYLWVFSSPRIPRESNKYHGYIVRGTPNSPLQMEEILGDIFARDRCRNASPKSQKNQCIAVQMIVCMGKFEKNYCPYHPWDWHIYPHLVDFYGNSREIYHTWMVWGGKLWCPKAGFVENMIESWQNVQRNPSPGATIP